MQKIVFCDFDGTISVEETFVGMLKTISPELYNQFIPEIYAKRLTLRAGVRQILESIPSARYPEIIEYARSQLMRPGLEDFLDFLDAQSVPFIVVSGGLRSIVETILAPFLDRVQAIYALDINTTDTYLKVHSDFEDGDELLAKVRVMELYPAEEQIAIGDSITDLNMALHASLVFARDRLCPYLDAQHKSYILWDNFFDIRDRLSEKWGLGIGAGRFPSPPHPLSQRRGGIIANN